MVHEKTVSPVFHRIYIREPCHVALKTIFTHNRDNSDAIFRKSLYLDAMQGNKSCLDCNTKAYSRADEIGIGRIREPSGGITSYFKIFQARSRSLDNDAVIIWIE